MIRNSWSGEEGKISGTVESTPNVLMFALICFVESLTKMIIINVVGQSWSCLQLQQCTFIFSVVQTKETREKVEDYLHEVDKPLARYRDDEDLEKMLKDQEREDDPMLAYMKQKKKKQDVKEGKKGLCLGNCK